MTESVIVVFPKGVGVSCRGWFRAVREIAQRHLRAHGNTLRRRHLGAARPVRVRAPNFDTAFGLMHTIEKAAAIYAEARMLNGGSDQFRNTITDDGLRAIARDFKLDINESFLD